MVTNIINQENIENGSIFKKLNFTKRLQWKEGWRNVVGWWLIGMLLDFGYWIFVVSAAHDLLSMKDQSSSVDEEVYSALNSTKRTCNSLSAGFLLIPGTLPSLTCSLILPFLSLWVNLRVFVVVVLCAVSYCLIGADISWTWTVVGVSFTSAYIGIGLTTLLSHLALYNNNKLISAWSTGIGASGFFASLLYLVLMEYEVPLKIMSLSLLVVPLTLALAFWFLLSKPIINNEGTSYKTSHISFKERLRIFYNISWNYLLPSFLVFFFQYLINQGIYELITFDSGVLSLAPRIRLFTFIYLFSNFIFKSSGELIDFSSLWTLAFLQILNFAVLMTQSIYSWYGDGIVAFFVTILLIICEGALAGMMYVNLYKELMKNRPERERGFSLSITAVVEPLGILIAGFSTVPLHNFICSLPPP